MHELFGCTVRGCQVGRQSCRSLTTDDPARSRRKLAPSVCRCEGCVRCRPFSKQRRSQSSSRITAESPADSLPVYR